MAEGVRLGADSLRRVTSAILRAGGSEDAEATSSPITWSRPIWRATTATASE